MQEINISIKYTNGQSFPVIIQKDEDTTVLEMKQQIETQSQIPANDQRLIFKGKVLKDELTIEEYGMYYLEHEFLISNYETEKQECIPICLLMRYFNILILKYVFYFIILVALQ